MIGGGVKHHKLATVVALSNRHQNLIDPLRQIDVHLNLATPFVSADQTDQATVTVPLPARPNEMVYSERLWGLADGAPFTEFD